MPRAFLIVYPFLILYVTVATLIMVPLTWVIRDIQPIYWVAQTGVRLALLLSGVTVRMVNEALAFGELPAVFVSNHVSNIEPAALFMILPRIAIILKKELGRIPLLGYVMKMGGFIYVDRKDRNSRRKALEASVAALKTGESSLLVFPEGTRSPDGELLPFRPGPFTIAIEAQAPIVPITVHGARELMPKGSAHMKPGRVELVFHEPVPTKGLASEQRGELMNRVRAVMEEGVSREAARRGPPQ